MEVVLDFQRFLTGWPGEWAFLLSLEPCLFQKQEKKEQKQNVYLGKTDDLKEMLLEKATVIYIEKKHD